MSEGVDKNGESKETRRARNAQPHNRAARREYARSQHGRAVQRAAQERYRATNPEKISAQHAAREKHGESSAESHKCAVCGARAEHKHHHKGYGDGAATSVRWLCQKHHVKAHHPKSNITEKNMSTIFQDILKKNITGIEESELRDAMGAAGVGAGSPPPGLAIASVAELAPEAPASGHLEGAPSAQAVDASPELSGAAVGEPGALGAVPPGAEGAPMMKGVMSGIFAGRMFIDSSEDERIVALMQKGGGYIAPEAARDPRSVLTRAKMCKACNSPSPELLKACPKCGADMEKGEAQGVLTLGAPVRLPFGVPLRKAYASLDGSLKIG